MTGIDILCPHCGKHSSDPDFCSECGRPTAAAPAGAVPADSRGDPVRAGGEAGADPAACPDCGEPRSGPGARFCDNCRYDFQARRSFVPAPGTVPQTVPVPAAEPAPAAPAAFDASGFARWEIVASVDPSQRAPDSPEAPEGVPDRVFPLLEENLIGRRSEKQGVFPAIPLEGDTGVSRRHAVVTRNPDGTITLLDLNSTNRTRLNGAEIPPNVPTPLADGDVVTAGHWSRLTLRAR